MPTPHCKFQGGGGVGGNEDGISSLKKESCAALQFWQLYLLASATLRHAEDLGGASPVGGVTRFLSLSPKQGGRSWLDVRWKAFNPND